MPKGTVAPGKVLPSSCVPMKGFTRPVSPPSRGSAAWAAGGRHSAEATTALTAARRERRVRLIWEDLRKVRRREHMGVVGRQLPGRSAGLFRGPVADQRPVRGPRTRGARLENRAVVGEQT